MDLEALGDRALEIRCAYEVFEREAYGRAWTLEELTLGLVGDVGDLAKLIQAHEGVRAIPNADAALAHELADVLWSVLVIARRCEIDLEDAFLSTMDELAAGLGGAP